MPRNVLPAYPVVKVYRLGPSGRRLALILMLGSLLLWCSAIWLLQAALGIDYTNLGSSIRATLENGLGLAQLIPGGVLLALIVMAPLLFWSLWQEWTTSYTLSDDGLTYRTAAGTLQYPWTAVRGIALEDDETLGAVLVAPEALRGRPLSRWLFRQAFGADRVPLYAGVENRDELVLEITRRIGARTIAV